MARFNLKKAPTKTTNLAGGIALKHSAEMELVVSVLTTFLEDKFYETGDERLERIKKLIAMVKPEFVAKLAVVARTQFHMRSVSHVLLGELSKIHRGDSLVSRAIVKAAERPDDLIEIASYVGKPIPKQVKLGIAKALTGFNRYQLAKYRGEGKQLKMVDLFNLVHPKPVNEEQKKDWKDLMEGNLKAEDTWEARLSSGEDKGKVWKDLILEDQIGYMALLRNLRNIDEQADEKTKETACKMIADPERVKKSKQLPFRFMNAYENVSNQDMLEAIAKAMDISLDNVPVFKGKTLLAIDKSGSMNGDPIKKAAIFAAALMKNNTVDTILYSDNVKEVKYLKGTPVLTLAEKIEKDLFSGGTNTSLVFEYATINSGVHYDRIIILSDNESWVDDWMGGTQTAKNNHARVNNCFVYAMDLAGYGTRDIGGDKVFHLAGWSEKIFDFMEWIEKENQIIDFINKTIL